MFSGEVGMDAISQLSEGSIDLSREFRISHRSVIKRSFVWIFVFAMLALCAATAGWNSRAAIGDDNLANAIQHFLALFLLAGTAICAVKLLYEELYRACYHYGIEAGHLVISKGVILKQRGAFPLTRITDVYLERAFRDFIFGLCNLQFSTPTTHSGKFARIDGLSKKTAVALQHRLTALLATVPTSMPASAESPPANGHRKDPIPAPPAAAPATDETPAVVAAGDENRF